MISRFYLNDGLVTSVSYPEGNAPPHAVVFPNPNFDGRAMIRYQATQSGYLQLKLSDVSGRVMQVQRVAVAAGQNDIPLQNQNLGSGLYFIHLNDGRRFGVLKLVVR